MADEAWRLGPALVSDSYLRADKIIEIAKNTGAEAIHPGYGFLSENPEFVEACQAAGIVFIGPSAEAIRAMGLKDAAKKLMIEANVAVVPGFHGDEQDPDFLAAEAERIGYPVLIKARAGGGGKGMRMVEKAADFAGMLDSARREGEAAFGDGHVLIEKFITSPRHIEVQVFGDTHGNTVHLFERDCSLQRRHQKVIEEAPAPGMTDVMRTAMGEAAVRAAKAVDYAGAGTVEFIVDASAGLQPDRFYFMEMNTRLQVEHPVTEGITGLDLVEWQLRVAAGETLPLAQSDLTINGHSFEARVYAEDAVKGFVPAIGKLSHLYLPADLARIDSAVNDGDEITPFYDPMIAKVTVHAATRTAALNKLVNALQASRIAGCTTNIDFLARLASHEGFRNGEVDTGLIGRELDSLVSGNEPDHTVLALAALALSGLADKSAESDPWDKLSGWSHWGDRAQHIDLLLEDQLFELTATQQGQGHLLIAHDGHTQGLQLLEQFDDHGSQRLRVSLDGQVVVAHVLVEDAAVTVFHAGHTVRFDLPDYLNSTEDSGSAANQLQAPMPGQVKIISTAVGETVEEGQSLMVMEAMKMELTLAAPRDGVVAEITVEAGDQVTDGTVLLTLEEDA
ncbi:MAG: 3-methylcrotonyl-CoA carboxylase [Proteobacteria bacterium]|nr:MAG: 3-methylcrotonyl-CoA carboxylase [Pseudomonadota bacterium]